MPHFWQVTLTDGEGGLTGGSVGGAWTVDWVSAIFFGSSSSLLDLRNSLIPLPMAPPTSGSLPTPKMMMTMARTKDQLEGAERPNTDERRYYSR